MMEVYNRYALHKCYCYYYDFDDETWLIFNDECFKVPLLCNFILVEAIVLVLVVVESGRSRMQRSTQIW